MGASTHDCAYRVDFAVLESEHSVDGSVAFLAAFGRGAMVVHSGVAVGSVTHGTKVGPNWGF